MLLGLRVCIGACAAVLAAAPVRAAAPAKPAEAPAPPKLRIVGPPAVEPRGFALYRIEMLEPGATEWKRVSAEAADVRVSGQALFVEDPSARPVNPFQISSLGLSTGTAAVAATAFGVTAEIPVRVGPAGPAGLFSAQILADRPLHRYAGLGAGVMSHEDQWDITTTRELYDWCFRDVRAQTLRVLLRPDYEPENDNRDPARLREDAFDFTRLERPARVLRAALDRCPGLRIRAELLAPPPWLADRVARSGTKPDSVAAQELAEYLFATLRFLKKKGVAVSSLSPYDGPGGMAGEGAAGVPNPGNRAALFREVSGALEKLIAGDPELKTAPVRVVPDAASKPERASDWAPEPALGDAATGAACGRAILDSLTLGPGEWTAPEWCRPADRPGGLVVCDWNARKPRLRFWRSKAYHVFRQIANTTPPGGPVLRVEAKTDIPDAGPDPVRCLAVRGADSILCHLQNTHHAPLRFRVFWPTAAANGVEGLVTDLARDGADLPPGAIEVSPPVRGFASASGLLPPFGLVSLRLPAGP